MSEMRPIGNDWFKKKRQRGNIRVSMARKNNPIKHHYVEQFDTLKDWLPLVASPSVGLNLHPPAAPPNVPAKTSVNNKAALITSYMVEFKDGYRWKFKAFYETETEAFHHSKSHSHVRISAFISDAWTVIYTQE